MVTAVAREMNPLRKARICFDCKDNLMSLMQQCFLACSVVPLMRDTLNVCNVLLGVCANVLLALFAFALTFQTLKLSLELIIFNVIGWRPCVVILPRPASTSQNAHQMFHTLCSVTQKTRHPTCFKFVQHVAFQHSR